MEFIISFLIFTVVIFGLGGGIAAAFLLDGMRKRIRQLEERQRLYLKDFEIDHSRY